MFETKEKKQLFANWLWQVANADDNMNHLLLDDLHYPYIMEIRKRLRI